VDPIKRLIELATHEVGTHEVGGNNRGPRIEQYQSATWLKPAPWPWCAAFICWIVREWLLSSPEACGRLELRTKAQAESWRPRTAGAFDFERWAKEKNLRVLGSKALAKAGDIVVFDFSHIGLVVKDQIRPATTLETIEGNTNSKGARDSKTGDGVWRKRRPSGSIRSLIRILA
jgi:CHAP domain